MWSANRIVGTKALCAALNKAQEHAVELGFGLLLWDGYRPQRAVGNFVRWAQEPEDGRKKQRHYPNIDSSVMFEKGHVATKSGHTRGSTVDLTIYHLASGELAAIGGDHAVMDEISHHGAAGITTEEPRTGSACATSWSPAASSPTTANGRHYTLQDEPYPDTYFDFSIE
jgi:D-alanyl-D-alanine dipeptidase